MFLENEGWELCPVRYSFTILQLQVRKNSSSTVSYQLLSARLLMSGLDVYTSLSKKNA